MKGLASCPTQEPVTHLSTNQAQCYLISVIWGELVTTQPCTTIAHSAKYWFALLRHTPLYLQDCKTYICWYYTNISEVTLSAFIYRLFHEDLSSIIITNTVDYAQSSTCFICRLVIFGEGLGLSNLISCIKSLLSYLISQGDKDHTSYRFAWVNHIHVTFHKISM